MSWHLSSVGLFLIFKLVYFDKSSRFFMFVQLAFNGLTHLGDITTFAKTWRNVAFQLDKKNTDSTHQEGERWCQSSASGHDLTYKVGKFYFYTVFASLLDTHLYEV